MSTIKAAKAALRENVKNSLKSIAIDSQKSQSEQIYHKLLNLPIFKKSQRISVYLSTDNEVSTEKIVKTIFELGKTCFVPRYNQNIMEMVKLEGLKDWESLPLTKWKIKQPDLREERENAVTSGGLDLVIVPGVAFTYNGRRLGHGKGYYDYFLSHLKNNQAHPVFTLALAFKEQMFNDVPIENHDVPIDKILYAD